MRIPGVHETSSPAVGGVKGTKLGDSSKRCLWVKNKVRKWRKRPESENEQISIEYNQPKEARHEVFTLGGFIHRSF